MCEMTLRGQMSQNVKYAAHFCASFSSSSCCHFLYWAERLKKRTTLKMHLWRLKDNEHEHPLNIHIMNKKNHVYQFNLHNVCVVLIDVFVQMLKNVDI